MSRTIAPALIFGIGVLYAVGAVIGLHAWLMACAEGRCVVW